MKILTVRMFNRKGDENDFVELDLDEVNYIDLWQRTKNSDKVLAYHTSHGSYLGLSRLIDAYVVCKPYGFDLIGRSALVNQNKIKSIEPDEHKGSIVHFFDGSHINVRRHF